MFGPFRPPFWVLGQLPVQILADRHRKKHYDLATVYPSEAKGEGRAAVDAFGAEHLSHGEDVGRLLSAIVPFPEPTWLGNLRDCADEAARLPCAALMTRGPRPRSLAPIEQSRVNDL